MTAGVHAAGRAAVPPTAAAAAHAASPRLGALASPSPPAPARAFLADAFPRPGGGDSPLAHGTAPAAAAPPSPPANSVAHGRRGQEAAAAPPLVVSAAA